jgi:hypothetical protein
MNRTVSLLAGLLLSGAALNASAGVIPYNNAGTEAPVSTFVAAADGVITAYFKATDAGWDSQIGLLVNGVSTGVFGLPNHSAAYGQSLVLGSVHAGDSLEFVLNVLTTGGSWFSVAAHNSDQHNHIYSTNFTGDSFIPTGTYIGFEDQSNLGDVDYNDHQFVFTNIKNTSVPEPTGLGLVFLGLGALGWARKRQA